MNLKYDSKALDDFIKDIKSKLRDYDVNESNVNDFAVMLEERNNCCNCEGLEFCKNNSRGLKTEYIDGEFKLLECKYKKEAKLKAEKSSLIKNLYLPSKILEADFQYFDTNTDSRAKIFKYSSDFIRKMKNKENVKGLYLYGDFSIGKTYALSCILNELAKNDINCLLIYFTDLLVDLRNAQINNRTRYEELINELKTVDVLMFDDFGSEEMTPWVRDEILSPIINYRCLEGKPIFVSSNLKTDDLALHIQNDLRSKDAKLKAERIISRMMSLCIAVDMTDSIKKYER